jgi:hypothetical protein
VFQPAQKRRAYEGLQSLPPVSELQAKLNSTWPEILLSIASRSASAILILTQMTAAIGED